MNNVAMASIEYRWGAAAAIRDRRASQTSAPLRLHGHARPCNARRGRRSLRPLAEPTCRAEEDDVLVRTRGLNLETVSSAVRQDHRDAEPEALDVRCLERRRRIEHLD
jgi:hypothetical protein